jgi:hypothetical protein
MYIKLPSHIQESDVEKLIDRLDFLIRELMDEELDACNLQPTTRAARLAAEAAVCVLLAHEIGQEIGQENSNPTPVLETLDERQ